jgi:hypothetical protein
VGAEMRLHRFFQSASGRISGGAGSDPAPWNGDGDFPYRMIEKQQIG